MKVKYHTAIIALHANNTVIHVCLDGGIVGV